MEFSSLRYCSLWAIISLVFLLIALLSLERVKPSFLEIIGFNLKMLICYVAGFSYFCAFFFLPMKEPDLTNGSVLTELGSFCAYLAHVLGAAIWLIDLFGKQLSAAQLISLSLDTLLLVHIHFHYVYQRYAECKEMGNLFIGVGGPFLLFPSHARCWALFTASLFAVAYLVSCQDPREAKEYYLFVPSFLLSIFGSLPLALALKNNQKTRLLTQSLEKNKGNISMIGTFLGLLGYVLSQYWLPEKSIPLLVMLSSFAIHWLANLALTRSRTDFGFLNFLIGAILDCAISLFGLHIFTWIVFAACAIMLLLRSKLDSVTLRYPRPRTSTMSNWLSVEKKVSRASHPLVIRLYKMIFAILGGFIVMKVRRLWWRLLRADDSSVEEKRSEQEEESKDELIGKLITENKAVKDKESKVDLIDKLRNFTLQQLRQKENGKEEGSRDELIHTLYHLYFRLCKEEEKGRGEQAKKYHIALCLYQVLCLLQKKENGNEEEKEKKEDELEDEQEKDKAKEVEENEKAVTKEAQIIRLSRLIFGMLFAERRKQGSKNRRREGKRRKGRRKRCRLYLRPAFVEKRKGKRNI